MAIALALLDFTPILLLSLGLFFLAQLVDRLDHRCRRMALSGFALVAVGGLARATSNLALAITGQEIPLLATLLHVFSGPGFTLMAGALIRARAISRGRQIARDPWILPTAFWWAFLLAALYLSGSPGGDWNLVLLALALIGRTTTCAATAVLGWARQLHMAAGLLGFNALATGALVALRFLAPANLWTQLIGQVLYLSAEAAFAFACWRVAAEYHARVGPIAGN